MFGEMDINECGKNRRVKRCYVVYKKGTLSRRRVWMVYVTKRERLGVSKAEVDSEPL